MADLRTELAALLRAADQLSKKNPLPKIPKYKFLTIPDFPDYEINGYLKVRNKITGKTKKPIKRHKSRIQLTNNKRRIGRDLLSLYIHANLEVIGSNTWTKIFSAKGLYEINRLGLVRNARTKKILKPAGKYTYRLQIGKQRRDVSAANLLNECYAENYSPQWYTVAVVLKKDNAAYSFKTIKAASQWLAPRIFYCASIIRGRMNARQPEIGGYQVAYFPKKVFKSYETL